MRIFKNFFRRKIDHLVLYKKERWIFYIALLLFIFIRVIWTQGYYAVIYLLGFYIVQNLLLYVTPSGLPSIDEEEEQDNNIFDIPDTIQLEKNEDNSKPVIRKLNEFVLWKKLTFFTGLALLCTFLDVFDFPVFWPLLLFYFIIMSIQMGIKQYRHMKRYGYGLNDFFKKHEKTNEFNQYFIFY